MASGEIVFQSPRPEPIEVPASEIRNRREINLGDTVITAKGGQIEPYREVPISMRSANGNRD